MTVSPNRLEVRQGDSGEVLRELADNSVDAVVTDPPYGLSLMGHSWDQSVPAADLWREVFRVLKPGGHLLAFGGARTYHRLATAIEEAGFDIRDQIMWIHGQGYSSSLDVAKAISSHQTSGGSSPRDLRRHRQGDAYQPTGQIDYAKGRRFSNDIEDDDFDFPLTPDAERWQGWGTTLAPAHEPIAMARKPLSGSVSAQVLEWGTGGINGDHCRSDGPGKGRWPKNVAFDEAAAAGLDLQKGGASRFFYVAKPSTKEKNAGLDHLPRRGKVFNGQSSRPGSCLPGSVEDKFSTAPQANYHSTVKPVALMRWLCAMVTPPGGLVLDPFAGSGTTGIAAALEGFDFLGIELDPDFVAIARARIAHWNEYGELAPSIRSQAHAKSNQPTLFDTAV